jgi:predicted DNA-binding transcriptional regulator AlpA
MTKQFTTARDVAELLNLPLPRIYEVTRKGFFPTGVVVRIGRQIRYNRESLLSWLQNGGTVEQDAGERGTQFK